MEKERVVITLRELADILEVADANTFEVAAYRNAAQSLDDWDGNLKQTVQDQNVTSIPAVGKGLGQLISNLVSTGHSEELERIRGLVPSELPQILKIRGLGPKRVKLLWQELDIDSPASLRKAAINGNVKNLKGFGPKLVERILSGLDYLEGSRTPPKPKTTTVAVQTAHAGGRLFAGVSGFSYAGWKGRFYPQETKASDFLSIYSTRLSTVEINNTFYRFPSQKVVDQWQEQTPESFLFSIKAHRKITHLYRLSHKAEQTIVEFVERCGHLGDRLGCILFQLPPNLPFDRERLDLLLRTLPAGPRYAIEFRHDSWCNDDVLGQLAEKNIAVVQRNPQSATNTTADFAYARLPAEMTKESVDQWSSWFNTQVAAKHDVFAYVKHDDVGLVPQLILDRWSEPGKPRTTRRVAASADTRTAKRTSKSG